MNDPRKGLPSASGAESYALCPGKFQAERGLESSADSLDAASGRAAHTALMQSQSENDTAELAREIETRTVTPLLHSESKCFHEREQRFFGHDLETLEPICTGQIDSYWVTPDFKTGIIEDLKSLYGDHEEAPTNMQLRWYAALLWEEFRFDHCYVFINQPMITRKPVIALYSLEDLEQAHVEMIALAKRVSSGDLPRAAGAKQCKFCAAKDSCQDHSQWTSSLKPVELRNLPLARWTPQDWTVFLDRRGELKEWISRHEKEAKRRLAADAQSIPGWGIGKAKVNHLVTKPDLVWERVNHLGTSLEQFMACIEINKGRLKDAVRTATGARGASLESAMQEIFNGVTSDNPCEAPLERKKTQ